MKISKAVLESVQASQERWAKGKKQIVRLTDEASEKLDQAVLDFVKSRRTSRD